MKRNTQQFTENFGQMGNIHCAGIEAVTCAIDGRAFVAITFLEDTKFATDAAGLTAASADLFMSSARSSIDIDSNAGDVTGAEVFPKGLTIYGRWSGFKLSEGRVLAYIG